MYIYFLNSQQRLEEDFSLSPGFFINFVYQRLLGFLWKLNNSLPFLVWLGGCSLWLAWFRNYRCFSLLFTFIVIIIFLLSIRLGLSQLDSRHPNTPTNAKERILIPYWTGLNYLQDGPQQSFSLCLDIFSNK